MPEIKLRAPGGGNLNGRLIFQFGSRKHEGMNKNRTAPDGALKYETLLLALAAVVVIFIYAGSLTAPFVFDDLSNIRDNPNIRMPQINLHNLAWSALHSPEKHRPVANISFALNYYFNGYNVVGYRVVNILIHLITGIVFYALAKATLKLPALEGVSRQWGWIAFFSALIWMIHPLQTQSVTYLIQRMNSMSAMFYVSSMLLYVKFRLTFGRGKKWLLFSGCAAAGLLALGTKEVAATLPVFIFLYEWYFFQNLDRRWIRRRAPLLAGIVLAVGFIALVYLDYHPFAKILSDYENRDFTLVQRVLTEFRVVIFYISLIFWPHPSRLNLEHDFSLSHGLLDPVSTLAAVVLIIALLAAAVITARRSPLVSFGIVWFFGNLVIESSFIGLELVFEHRNYLPSMFLILAIVWLLYRWIKPVWAVSLMLCAVVALLSLWSFERNRVWSDEVTLYRDCVAKSPGKARAHNNLGAALASRSRLEEAVKQYRRALEINPGYADAHYNLGYALARQGKLDAALAEFSLSLRLNPRRLETHNNMGVVLMLQDRPRKAIEHFKAALKLNPSDADVQNNLGFALKTVGELDAAAGHFLAALKINPRRASTYNNLGEIMLRKGRLAEARRYFVKALQLSPDYGQARKNLEEIDRRLEK